MYRAGVVRTHVSGRRRPLVPVSIRDEPVDLAGYDQEMQVTAALTRDGGWYVARCLEVEVTSQGRTVEDALANLREALELYFEDAELPTELEPPIIATIRLSA